MLVAFAAGLIPALRASRIEPMMALAPGLAALAARGRAAARGSCGDDREWHTMNPPCMRVPDAPRFDSLLCLLFLLSGACGLTYQVLWLRLLALVFGVTVHAASTVLASFMAGLALGSILAERLARRGHPLRVFAALEAGIAVSALATPALLGAG